MKKLLFKLFLLSLFSLNSLSALILKVDQSDSNEKKYNMIKKACEQSHRHHIDKEKEKSCSSIMMLPQKIFTKLNSFFGRRSEINDFPLNFEKLKLAAKNGYQFHDGAIRVFILDILNQKKTYSLKISSLDNLYMYCTQLSHKYTPMPEMKSGNGLIAPQEKLSPIDQQKSDPSIVVLKKPTTDVELERLKPTYKTTAIITQHNRDLNDIVEQTKNDTRPRVAKEVDQPNTFESVTQNRHFVVPDIHGDLKVYLSQILPSNLFVWGTPTTICVDAKTGNTLNDQSGCGTKADDILIPNISLTQNACEQKEKITFLGDLIDRGRFGAEIVYLTHKLLNDPHNQCKQGVIPPIEMVAGNHETNILQNPPFIRDYSREDASEREYRSFMHPQNNTIYSRNAKILDDVRNLIKQDVQSDKIKAIILKDKMIFSHANFLVVTDKNYPYFSEVKKFQSEEELSREADNANNYFKTSFSDHDEIHIFETIHEKYDRHPDIYPKGWVNVHGHTHGVHMQYTGKELGKDNTQAGSLDLDVNFSDAFTAPDDRKFTEKNGELKNIPVGSGFIIENTKLYLHHPSQYLSYPTTEEKKDYVFAFDFDQTITQNHTYQTTKKSKWTNNKTDEELKNQFPLREGMVDLINKILASGNSMNIVTFHNNPAFIKTLLKAHGIQAVERINIEFIDSANKPHNKNDMLEKLMTAHPNKSLIFVDDDQKNINALPEKFANQKEKSIKKYLISDGTQKDIIQTLNTILRP